MSPKERQLAALLTALERHQHAITQAEAVRLLLVEPALEAVVADCFRFGPDEFELIGAEHTYLIDRRGRVMTKKKG